MTLPKFMELDELRSLYLNNIWEPYPVRPTRHDFAGCINSLDRENTSIEVETELGVFVNKPIDAEWCRRLRVGDWISGISKANGELGEIFLLAPNLTLAAKAFWQGRAVARTKKIQLARWQEFQFYAREFFLRQGFLEIHTPSLVVSPGTEPYLDVFSCELVVGRQRQKLFLPTSPELSLKKAMAQGYSNIYEIRNCFRNGEISETHQPEFTMLEWYRHYASLEDIKADIKNLIKYLAEKMKVTSPQSYHQRTVQECFKERFSFELLPTTSAEQLKELAKKENVSVGRAESFDDLFFHLFLERIEPSLPTGEPLFLQSYPPSQAALARLDAAGWGDRFELYWRGLEIANAFHELNDPQIQRQRSQEDLEKKMSLGKESVPLDEAFFKSLEQGLPPASGVALGLDRLFMAMLGIPQISDFRLFPY